jgi:hypothetical protein
MQSERSAPSNNEMKQTRSAMARVPRPSLLISVLGRQEESGAGVARWTGGSSGLPLTLVANRRGARGVGV